jgi:hypothetical protein
MVNRLYDAGRQSFLEGASHWLTDNFKCVLVDVADYVVNTATHANLSDIPAAARVGTTPNLANKTATAGVADADDVTFPNVTGDPSEALVIYKDTGTESTSTLIVYIDSATGLPVIPNTGPIAIQWPNDANKIFKL